MGTHILVPAPPTLHFRSQSLYRLTDSHLKPLYLSVCGAGWKDRRGSASVQVGVTMVGEHPQLPCPGDTRSTLALRGSPWDQAPAVHSSNLLSSCPQLTLLPHHIPPLPVKSLAPKCSTGGGMGVLTLGRSRARTLGCRELKDVQRAYK